MLGTSGTTSAHDFLGGSVISLTHLIFPSRPTFFSFSGRFTLKTKYFFIPHQNSLVKFMVDNNKMILFVQDVFITVNIFFNTTL